jgi:hypothetical protein
LPGWLSPTSNVPDPDSVSTAAAKAAPLVSDRLKAKRKASDGVQYLNRLCIFCDFPRLSAAKHRMRGLWMLDHNLIKQPNEILPASLARRRKRRFCAVSPHISV